MPSVDTSKPAKAKVGTSWYNWNIVRGKVSGTWTIGKKVWRNVSGTWVEIWNARPEVTTGSFTATNSALSFTGSVDPNNFTATASYRYREVGTSTWSNSTSTTKSGDGAQSYSVTATITDGLKNWEAQAVATNAAGTADTPTNAYLDCRRHDNGGSGWSTTTQNFSDPTGCESCGTKTRTDTTYSKTGCPSYTVTGTYGSCSHSWTQVTTPGTYTTTDGVTAYYDQYFTDWLGFGGYLRRQGCKVGNCGCSCQEQQGWIIEYCSATGQYRRSGPYCVTYIIFCP